MSTSWTIVAYRVPNDPSRHRVALWRELRRLGAVSLQQATWALPAALVSAEAFERIGTLVERADGELFVFDAEPSGDTGARLEALFVAAREDEWHEFVRECDKFEAELDHEEEIGKFTPAELDEEEQSLERLRRWFRELRARDVFGAPSAPEAELRLKSSTERFERYADRVYEIGGAP
jgi:ChrB-like protein